MTDIDQIPVILNSSDVGAVPGSTNSDFTVLLGDPLDVSDGEYECSLVDCSFLREADADLTPTPRSIIIYVDMLTQMRMGSQSGRMLYKTRPITQQDPEVFYDYLKTTVPQYKKVQAVQKIAQIRVTVTDSTGKAIPAVDSAGHPFPTFIQVTLRKVRSFT
jgi:hypothetical protein